MSGREKELVDLARAPASSDGEADEVVVAQSMSQLAATPAGDEEAAGIAALLPDPVSSSSSSAYVSPWTPDSLQTVGAVLPRLEQALVRHRGTAHRLSRLVTILRLVQWHEGADDKDRRQAAIGLRENNLASGKIGFDFFTWLWAHVADHLLETVEARTLSVDVLGLTEGGEKPNWHEYYKSGFLRGVLSQSAVKVNRSTWNDLDFVRNLKDVVTKVRRKARDFIIIAATLVVGQALTLLTEKAVTLLLTLPTRGHFSELMRLFTVRYANLLWIASSLAAVLNAVACTSGGPETTAERLAAETELRIQCVPVIFLQSSSAAGGVEGTPNAVSASVPIDSTTPNPVSSPGSSSSDTSDASDLSDASDASKPHRLRGPPARYTPPRSGSKRKSRASQPRKDRPKRNKAAPTAGAAKPNTRPYDFSDVQALVGQWNQDPRLGEARMQGETFDVSVRFSNPVSIAAGAFNDGVFLHCSQTAVVGAEQPVAAFTGKFELLSAGDLQNLRSVRSILDVPDECVPEGVRKAIADSNQVLAFRCIPATQLAMKVNVVWGLNCGAEKKPDPPWNCAMSWVMTPVNDEDIPAYPRPSWLLRKGTHFPALESTELLMEAVGDMIQDSGLPSIATLLNRWKANNQAHRGIGKSPLDLARRVDTELALEGEEAIRHNARSAMADPSAGGPDKHVLQPRAQGAHGLARLDSAGGFAFGTLPVRYPLAPGHTPKTDVWSADVRLSDALLVVRDLLERLVRDGAPKEVYHKYNRYILTASGDRALDLINVDPEDRTLTGGSASSTMKALVKAYGGGFGLMAPKDEWHVKQDEKLALRAVATGVGRIVGLYGYPVEYELIDAGSDRENVPPQAWHADGQDMVNVIVPLPSAAAVAEANAPWGFPSTEFLLLPDQPWEPSLAAGSLQAMWTQPRPGPRSGDEPVDWEKLLNPQTRGQELGWGEFVAFLGAYPHRGPAIPKGTRRRLLFLSWCVDDRTAPADRAYSDTTVWTFDRIKRDGSSSNSQEQ